MAEINAELRERFLRFIASMAGKKVEIAMFEKTNVSGKFLAAKGDGSHYIIGQLQTPIGIEDVAVLRTNDTISMDSYKIVEFYRNIVDAYTIDIFVEDHWNLIPYTWRTAFENYGYEEWKNILDANKPLLKMYPLSFLCLRQYFVNLIKRRKEITPVDLNHLLGIPDTDTAYLAVSSRENFRKRIKQKKQHEIDRIVHLVKKIRTTKSECSTIVDVGCGLGHLSRFLTLISPEVQVLTVEANSEYVHKAQEIDTKMMSIFKGASMPERIECFLDDNSKQRITESVAGENGKALLVGLHTCGDLSATILRSFKNFDAIDSVILVGCCYHKLNSGEDKLFQQQWGESRRETDAQSGFPLSKICSQVRLSFTAREAACHAVEHAVCNLNETSSVAKNHFYRAIMELALWEWEHSFTHRHIPVKGVKKLDLMEFENYIEQALYGQDIYLQAVRNEIKQNRRIQDILSNSTLFINRTMIFYYLRLVFAPIIEDIIIFDRKEFIKEAGYKTYGIPLFNPVLSPRNLVIFAHK